MRILKNTLVEGKYDKPIITDVYYKENRIKKPLVIFCHGYKGFKDWGVFDKMPETLVENQMFFVKFNFSHNGGTVEQPIDFPDLEAFGNNNFTKELDDLKAVIDWVTQNKSFEEEIDTDNIVLIGHSRGGGIVTLKASEDTRVKKLISWAAVSDYGARFPEGEALAYWKKEGVAYIENARTKQQMPHYIQFYNDFIENKERLNIQRAAKNIEIPHLIVHGGEDTTVPVEEAKSLHSWSVNSDFLFFPEADHVFGAKHPWEEPELPETFLKVLYKTIEFIEKS